MLPHSSAHSIQRYLNVSVLAVLRLVQPHLFFGGRNFHRRDLIDDRQHDVGEDKRVERGPKHRRYFLDEERRVAVHQSIRAAFGIHRLVSE